MVVISNKTAFILNFPLQVEICKTVSSCVYTPYSWLHLTHIDKDLHATNCQIDSVLWGERTAGCTAAAQCGIEGATPHAGSPLLCSMCTFPVMNVALNNWVLVWMFLPWQGGNLNVWDTDLFLFWPSWTHQECSGRLIPRQHNIIYNIYAFKFLIDLMISLLELDFQIFHLHFFCHGRAITCMAKQEIL